MQLDPRAIIIRTDGSCYVHARRASGCAAIVQYPDHLRRQDEQVVDFGCSESSINRMELMAVIRALVWIRENRPWPDVARVQIVTDSRYVADNVSRAAEWRSNRWRNGRGEPLENLDLWKAFLTARSRVGMNVTIGWTAGKRSPALRAIDAAAKAAARRAGPDVDRGYSRGVIARSKVNGTAVRFPASGQTAIIRPYRKNVMQRTGGENKVRFDVVGADRSGYSGSYYAYASPELASELHRQNGFLVRFNCDPGYPKIIEILDSADLPA